MKKIISVIAIHDRTDVAILCINRLKKCQTLPLFKVIVVGDTPGDRRTAKETNSIFVDYPNYPLSWKWQIGINRAREFSPDAILIMGSDDLISNNWCEEGMLMMDEDNSIGLVGSTQIRYLKLEDDKIIMMHWKGYGRTSKRHGEPIGAGRLISSKALDELGWLLWKAKKNGGLDGASYGELIEITKVGLLDLNSCFAIDVKSPGEKENLYTWDFMLKRIIGEEGIVEDSETETFLNTNF